MVCFDETQRLSTASVSDPVSLAFPDDAGAHDGNGAKRRLEASSVSFVSLADLMDRHGSRGCTSVVGSAGRPSTGFRDGPSSHRGEDTSGRIPQQRTGFSAEQLETAHLPLFLAVLEVVRPEADGALSLNGFCDHLACAPEAMGLQWRTHSQCALLKRGYIRQDAGMTMRTRVTGHTAFEVRAGFPRLVWSGVDARISRLGTRAEFDSRSANSRWMRKPLD